MTCLFYAGSVQLEAHIRDANKISEKHPDAHIATVKTSKAIFKILSNHVQEIDIFNSKNPYGLTLDEVRVQHDTAKVPSLQARVKRFACWHSCFGQFRKKSLKHPIVVRTSTAKPTSTSPLPVESPSTHNVTTGENNELGDGADEEDVIKVENKVENRRRKKASNPLDYFKLKTRMINAKIETETSVPTDFSTTTQSSHISEFKGYVKKSIITTEKSFTSPIQDIITTKAPLKFSSYLGKKNPAKISDAKPPETTTMTPSPTVNPPSAQQAPESGDKILVQSPSSVSINIEMKSAESGEEEEAPGQGGETSEEHGKVIDAEAESAEGEAEGEQNGRLFENHGVGLNLSIAGFY